MPLDQIKKIQYLKSELFKESNIEENPKLRQNWKTQPSQKTQGAALQVEWVKKKRILGLKDKLEEFDHSNKEYDFKIF